MKIKSYTVVMTFIFACISLIYDPLNNFAMSNLSKLQFSLSLNPSSS